MKKFMFLKECTMHDIEDSYKIALFDENMNPASEDELSEYVSSLEKMMAQMGIDVDNFQMDKEDNTVSFEQAMPADAEVSDYINDLTKKSLELADKNGLSAMMFSSFFGIHVGKTACLFENAAVLRGKYSFSESVFYQEDSDDDDDEDFYYVDAEDERMDIEEMVEIMADEMEDGFDSQDNPLYANDNEETEELREVFSHVANEMLEGLV